ncbi:MAG TPA: prepilin-type N-terminal cleavage/methylation domain-containing protein [Candidatus Methylomirabilis sp.]|nr:prepilin-type N-terminal cleavage/methylation domain-containing protein [Candidatus Methylomirabilis sp.]
MHELKKRAGLVDVVRGSPRTSFRRPKTGAGFTMAELLVSLTILLIIAVAVAGDINRSKFQEELSGSARLLVGIFRDNQAKALATTEATTCTTASGIKACDLSATGCITACSVKMPPYSYGVYLSNSSDNARTFTEVDPVKNDRRMDVGMEDLGTRTFLKGTAAVVGVRISSLTTNNGSVTNATVTFERQSGAMRINACDTPAPYTPACSGTPEPKTLDIVLTHQRTGQTRTVRLNAITGRISLD